MTRKVKVGFTLIEVSLFLAVTGMLFVGIVAGVQNSMFQQRYNDSVQNFAEFLRSLYSQTMNVENSDKISGRSEKAIYGKLVTFGESKNFEGQDNDDGSIFSYTVIGEINNEVISGDTLSDLGKLKANVVSRDDGAWRLAGIAERYFTRWGAAVQTTNGWNAGNTGAYQPFVGALLIVRNPRSGTVSTYVMSGKTVEVNSEPSENLLTSLLADFEIKQVDFCIDPNGGSGMGARRDVRIIRGARNASGVEIIGQDDMTEGTGNLCER